MNIIAIISTINTLLIVFFFQLGIKLVRKRVESDDERVNKKNNVYYTSGIFALIYGGIIMFITLAILFIDYLSH
jgi:uncharacterized membrane protein YbjE (DUF340 family)